MRIGDDHCTAVCVLANESLKGGRLGIGNNLDTNVAILSVGADDCRFANRAASRQQLLIGVLVLLATTNIGFINLDVIAHVVVGAREPRFANALGEEPSRPRRDAEFAGHLRGGDALTRRRHHIDRHEPRAEGRRLSARTVPVRTLKCWRQSRQRYGIGLWFLSSATERLPQWGLEISPAQRLFSKYCRAASSPGKR